MARLEDARIAAMTAALPPDAPNPEAFRYEAEYEALDAEIRKLERLGPAEVQWPEVLRQAQAILTTRSKDLGVLTWFVFALQETEGLKGLAVGLAVLRDTVEQFWDGLFPARPRARIGALEWLAGRAAGAMPAEVSADQGDAVIAAFEELDALDRFLGEHLPDAGAALLDLLRPLRSLAADQRRLAEERQRRAEQAATAPAATAAAPAPGPVSGPVLPDLAAAGGDPEGVLSALRDGIRTTALQLLEAHPAEPRAYQLLRAVTWLAVTELPPARDGRTELLAPPDMRRSEFDALAGAGNRPELVLALEKFCSGSGLFWLDGQRLSATALAEMGPAHAGCARAVARGVIDLLDRLPGLADLSFSDGTPFADAATRGWLETIRPAAAGADGGGAEAAPWTAAFVEARGKALAGQGEEALAGLADAGSAAPDGRARFFWRLGLARLCLETGAAPVALPILRQLDDLVERQGLEAWEPAAAAEVATSLIRCVAAPELSKTLAEAERSGIAQAAFARLARADPMAAQRTAKRQRN
ncbi:type VI secretion system protein TssA [Inquilinus sp. CA228]|uniref:type VI secretion system protein TssA n=1 Tax=Inquilinus sp. CA228 TaxID=3455609 RepID=UPI003F8CF588